MSWGVYICFGCLSHGLGWCFAVPVYGSWMLLLPQAESLFNSQSNWVTSAGLTWHLRGQIKDSQCTLLTQGEKMHVVFRKWIFPPPPKIYCYFTAALCICQSDLQRGPGLQKLTILSMRIIHVRLKKIKNLFFIFSNLRVKNCYFPHDYTDVCSTVRVHITNNLFFCNHPCRNSNKISYN